MFSNISLRKWKLIVCILLLISVSLLLCEKLKQRRIRLEKMMRCQKLKQVFKTIFLESGEDRVLLSETWKFSKDKKLMMQLMLIQECPWEPSATAVMQYRAELGQCCNASHLLTLTKENAPVGSTINFDGNKNINITVDSELADLLPEVLYQPQRQGREVVRTYKDILRVARSFVPELVELKFPRYDLITCPFYCYSSESSPMAGSQYSKCAIIGSGGILRHSGCGQQIDQADFIIRFNLPPMNYTEDVGTKTSLVTINPSIIKIKYEYLLGRRKPFVDALQAYKDALFLIPSLSFQEHIDIGRRAMYTMNDFGLTQRAFFLHPHYLSALDKYWKQKGLKEVRLSSGFMFTSLALEFCEHITLYGFWPFVYDLTGKPLSHHYYDNILPNSWIHTMPEEFLRYLNMYAQGVLRVQLGKCQ